LTTKIHLVCDGQARTLAFVLTGGQVADTSMFTDVLDEIHVSGRGHARTRPDRVLADKGYPSKKNRAWLRERGIKSTIPERADQIANRRKRPGRPIDFGDEQKERYKGRNVVERCFSFIKQWRGLASRYDKTACSYAAGLCLSAAGDKFGHNVRIVARNCISCGVYGMGKRKCVCKVFEPTADHCSIEPNV
jgi:transposase